MKILSIWVLIAILFSACDTPIFTPEEDFVTPFELSEGTPKVSYQETIDFYKKLATNYGSISLKTMGKTDSGIPLYLVVYNNEGVFDFNRIKKDKLIILIVNGSTSDDQEGIDASMQLMRNLAQKQIEIPENTVVATIPMMNYLAQIEQDPFFKNNINTFINRDLSEDFIENKSLNTQSFVAIFHQLSPHIFVDTRTLKAKENGEVLYFQSAPTENMGKIRYYLTENLIPQLNDSLGGLSRGVDSIAQKRLQYEPIALKIPDTSIGYTSLWNTLGLYIATHKGIPYKKRVEELHSALKSIILIANSHRELIKNLQELDSKELLQQQKYILSDSKDTIHIPEAYIIPQLFTDMIAHFKDNAIEMTSIEKDSLMDVRSYVLKTTKDSLPLLNLQNIRKKLLSQRKKVAVRKGDILIPTQQRGRKYLLETLEPHANNRFMRTNTFPFLSAPKDSLWVYPIFRIENKNTN